MRKSPIVFFILFFCIPLIEIYFLVKVGEQVGALLTIFLVVLTAVIGAFLLRQQGLSTFMRFQKNMAGGQMPAQEIVEGFMLLVGGVLLMTPGFFTDAIGFLCLIPFSRIAIAKSIAAKSSMKMNPGFQHGGGSAPDDHIFEGEYTRKDANANNGLHDETLDTSTHTDTRK